MDPEDEFVVGVESKEELLEYVGSEVGEGLTSVVYNHPTNGNKVIRVSKTYFRKPGSSQCFDRFVELTYELPNRHFPKVYLHEALESLHYIEQPNGSKWYDGNVVNYDVTVMEKLDELGEVKTLPALEQLAFLLLVSWLAEHVPVWELKRLDLEAIAAELGLAGEEAFRQWIRDRQFEGLLWYMTECGSDICSAIAGLDDWKSVGCNFDTHEKNIMRRGDEIVIIDPYYRRDG